MMRTMKTTTRMMLSIIMMMTVITFKELNSGPSLMVRGGFGDPEPEPESVHFEDEYEDLNAYRDRLVLHSNFEYI